jgi:hypothetical protein
MLACPGGDISLRLLVYILYPRLSYVSKRSKRQGGNCACGTRVLFLISVICFMFYLSSLLYVGLEYRLEL